MLVYSLSEAGSIREENQDVLVSLEDSGIFLLADGFGARGRELAQEVSDRAVSRLQRLQTQPSPGYAEHSFRQILKECTSDIIYASVHQPGFQGSSVALGVVFRHEGHLFLGRFGHVGMLAKVHGNICSMGPASVPPPVATLANALSPLPQITANTEPHIAGPFPITVGDWVLVCSQGVLLSQPLSEIEPLAPALVGADAEDLVRGLFHRAGQRYDGDDRSMAFLRFLPADLVRRFPPEQIVSEDYSGTWKVPLWAPLSVLAAAGTFALLLWRRFTR